MEPSRHHRFKELNPEPDQFYNIRQVLNLIFMIGAVVGVIILFAGNRTVGIIVVLASMVFKIAECAFRFFK